MPNSAAHPIWQLAYQSRSGPPSVPWLDPDINDVIDDLAAAGRRGVIVVPIGFVSDHVEVVWDLDNEAAETAAKHGLFFARVRTPGTDPRFVGALADLVEERLGTGDADPAGAGRRRSPARLLRHPLLCQLPGYQADHRRGRFGRGLGGQPGHRGGPAGAIGGVRHSAGRRDEPVTDRVLRVGTRGSALALAQSGAVAARIAENAGADWRTRPHQDRG